MKPQLTTDQEFVLEQVRRSLPTLPREQLEAELMTALKMSFSSQNAAKAIIKQYLDKRS